MTSWDQELGATNKPLCVGCAVVWGAHCHAVLAVLRACGCGCAVTVVGPTLQLSTEYATLTALPATLPAGWGGANSLVRGG